jgi:predicted transglutaminase-like cysteine proteinase
MLRNKDLPLLLGILLLMSPFDGGQAAYAAMAVGQETAARVGAASIPKKIKLFGSREMKSRSVKSFGKWTEMWRRHNLPRREDVAPSDSSVSENRRCVMQNKLACGRDAWNKFVSEQQGVPLNDLLKAVNLYMNKSTYVVDPINWGIPDYWSTPDEFFLKDGDCEDYAISKYITLKRLGVDAKDMRLVILQDENLRAAHAILAVRYEGKYMILDNQVDAVLPDTQILHYRPVYSINETGWWLHHKRRFTRD